MLSYLCNAAAAPRPLSQTPNMYQLVSRCRQLERQPRPMASRVHIHTHIINDSRSAATCLRLRCDASATFTGRSDECGPARYKRSQVFAAAAGIELRASQSSGMVCVQRRRSRTRASGQIRTVRRAHLRVRVLTARQTNSVRALQTAGRDAAEGPGDSVAARLRQPSGTPQPTGGSETPNRTPKAPDSPRLDVSCRARARGTGGFAGEMALIFQLGVFF